MVVGYALFSGFLLKKGAHSSSFTKRCVVLLADRLVVYENVGDPIALVGNGKISFIIGLYQFTKFIY